MPLHDTDLLEAASLTLKQAAQDGLAPVCLHIADATGAPLLFLRMAGSVERAVCARPGAVPRPGAAHRALRPALESSGFPTAFLSRPTCC